MEVEDTDLSILHINTKDYVAEEVGDKVVMGGSLELGVNNNQLVSAKNEEEKLNDGKVIESTNSSQGCTIRLDDDRRMEEVLKDLGILETGPANQDVIL